MYTDHTLASEFYQNTPFTLMAFFRELGENDGGHVSFKYHAHYAEQIINLFFNSADLEINKADAAAITTLCKQMAQLEVNEEAEQSVELTITNAVDTLDSGEWVTIPKHLFSAVRKHNVTQLSDYLVNTNATNDTLHIKYK